MTSKPQCSKSYIKTSNDLNAEAPSTTNTNETEGSASVSNTTSGDPASLQMRRAGKRNSDANEHLATEVLNSVNDYFKRPTSTQDRFDLFGAAVAAKLRDLTKRQRILAEKIINETLFEAEMENLTINHKVMNLACHSVTTCTNTPSPSAYTTSTPMQNPYYTTNSNIILGYPSQLAQPIPQSSHQAIIHPQPNIALPNPAVVEISIPESAAQYWSSFNYDNVQ